VWLDIGGGVNTVRLDNVGLINGGTGLRMSSPAVEPAGVYPGRPLFVLANDLEIGSPRRPLTPASDAPETCRTRVH
jgi:hypothetical protein